MKTLLKNAKVFENKGEGQFIKKDLLIDSDKLTPDFDNEQSNCLYDRVFDFKNLQKQKTAHEQKHYINGKITINTDQKFL